MHGHEEVAVQVDVRPVHYLLVRAEAESAQWLGKGPEAVPRGGRVRLAVTQLKTVMETAEQLQGKLNLPKESCKSL